MSLEVQWTDADPASGERRFVVAQKFARRWRFKVRHKRREDWTHDVQPTKAMWEDLLESLERRVQRREGAKDEDVSYVREQIAAFD